MSEYRPEGQSEQQIASQRLIFALASNIRSVTMQHIPTDQIVSYMEKPSFTCSIVAQTNTDYWELAAAQVNSGKRKGQKCFVAERLVLRPNGTQRDERIRYSFDDGAVALDELRTPSVKTNKQWNNPKRKIQSPYDIGLAFAELFSLENKDGVQTFLPQFSILGQQDAEKVLGQHKKIMLTDFDDMYPRRAGLAAPNLLGRISLIVWPR